MRIFESDGCHYLEIPQASFMDSGEYECVATNSEGTISVVIRLTVEGKGHIVFELGGSDGRMSAYRSIGL